MKTEFCRLTAEWFDFSAFEVEQNCSMQPTTPPATITDIITTNEGQQQTPTIVHDDRVKPIPRSQTTSNPGARANCQKLWRLCRRYYLL
ncbi:hypothetical protein T05_7320 [Trichinella murrelli]|uniref:Uncharacterized protein n=1 Tax=Trichinella murrelli TaxID=144512 RepID=A0A0V0UB81_9BILA|nr:hypothetical protein T05_7320 [Trichinella murrelli]